MTQQLRTFGSSFKIGAVPETDGADPGSSLEGSDRALPGSFDFTCQPVSEAFLYGSEKTVESLCPFGRVAQIGSSRQCRGLKEKGDRIIILSKVAPRKSENKSVSFILS